MRAKIALLPGDGIGPEVVAQGVRVLEAVAERWGHSFETTSALIGGAAIDATGNPLPDETVALCRASDDLVVVRELTGGIYFGEKSRTSLGDDGERAVDVCTYSTQEIERVVRVAGALALERRGKLTSVDKANVLETSRLWREVTHRVVAEEFPQLEIEHLLVDACAMHLLQRPASFDVIVTENMFGDILTDEASVLAGSIGLLPSASLGASVLRDGRQATLGIYEPIHGSAPDIAGKGLANPVGTIASTAMLLRYSLGLETEALAVEHAVHHALANGALTADIAPKGTAAKSTSEVADAIIGQLAKGLVSARA